MVERHDFLEDEAILLYLLPFEVDFEELELLEPQEGLQSVLPVDVLEHLIQDDVQLKSAVQVPGQQLVVRFDVQDQPLELLVVGPQPVEVQEHPVEHCLVVVLLPHPLLELLLPNPNHPVASVPVSFEPDVPTELLHLILVLYSGEFAEEQVLV